MPGIKLDIKRSYASLMDNKKSISEVWKEKYLRVFISHKSSDKKTAKDLKESLEWFGVTSFVAHEDINPTRHWQRVIEKALDTANVLIAILTDQFYESDWTQQEVGIAIGRGLLVIPIKYTANPKGFIAQYQAVRGHADLHSLSKELFEIFCEQDYLNKPLIEAVISRLEKSKSFYMTNDLMPFISKQKNLKLSQINRLERAFKHNRQFYEASEAQDFPKLLKQWKQRIQNIRK